MNEIDKKLKDVIAEFGCITGTLHKADEGEKFLSLVSYEGVPEFLLEKISTIPFGKGIAGAAAETKKPVTLCNLQEDLGGVAKEAARKTGAAGSLAVPILSENGERVLGTIGVGKREAYEYSEAERLRLSELGNSFIEFL